MYVFSDSLSNIYALKAMEAKAKSHWNTTDFGFTKRASNGANANVNAQDQTPIQATQQTATTQTKKPREKKSSYVIKPLSALNYFKP